MQILPPPIMMLPQVALDSGKSVMQAILPAS
jgi:hypothetical protein